MERNKLLKLASTVCKVLAVFQIAGIVLATIVLVHWHSDKEFYRKVRVTPKGVSFKVITTTTTIKDKANNIVLQKSEEKPSKADSEAQDEFTLADMTASAVYFTYLKGVVVMVFMFLIFKELGKIVGSVRTLQTFRTGNVQAFQKIGKYLFIVFLVSGFHFFATEGDLETSRANISFDFDSTPLILMLVAYVLAEIFKEGNRLYEEEQLTV